MTEDALVTTDSVRYEIDGVAVEEVRPAADGADDRPAEPIELPVDEQTMFVPPEPVARTLLWSTVSDADAADLWGRAVPESPRAVAEATRFTVSVDLDGIDVPVLLLAAETDPFVAPWTTSKLGVDGRPGTELSGRPRAAVRNLLARGCGLPRPVPAGSRWPGERDHGFGNARAPMIGLWRLAI